MSASYRHNIDQGVKGGMNGGKHFGTYDTEALSTLNSLSIELGLDPPYPGWNPPGEIRIACSFL
jgi:hypothetical protein